MSDLNSHSAAESGGSSHDHAQTKPRGKPYSRQIDWRLVALVGASVAAGAALGAGVALLTAPQSGEHTRLAMASKLRHSRPRQQSPWEKLSNELQKAARRKRFRRAASSERSASRDRY
ncbi:MAG: hypothetical protein ACR2GG_02645 [Gemmatimonadaceae bacterium]